MKLSIKYCFSRCHITQPKIKEIVIAKFSFLFVFTFYEQILSYGCETKTKLTIISFRCEIRFSKNIWGIKNLDCTDADEIKEQ